jgi:hypothetical protein
MAKRRRYRSQGPVTGLKTYFLIFVLCSIVALVLQVLFDAPEKMEQYANEKLESAVRSAVQSEVQAAKKEAASSIGK